MTSNIVESYVYSFPLHQQQQQWNDLFISYVRREVWDLACTTSKHVDREGWRNFVSWCVSENKYNQLHKIYQLSNMTTPPRDDFHLEVFGEIGQNGTVKFLETFFLITGEFNFTVDIFKLLCKMSVIGKNRNIYRYLIRYKFIPKKGNLSCASIMFSCVISDWGMKKSVQWMFSELVEYIGIDPLTPMINVLSDCKQEKFKKIIEMQEPIDSKKEAVAKLKEIISTYQEDIDTMENVSF